MENIITSNEEEEIKNIVENSEKQNEYCWMYSLVSLKTGNNDKFYAMLKVMKNHGDRPTQNLAELMKLG